MLQPFLGLYLQAGLENGSWILGPGSSNLTWARDPGHPLVLQPGLQNARFHDFNELDPGSSSLKSDFNDLDPGSRSLKSSKVHIFQPGMQDPGLLRISGPGQVPGSRAQDPGSSSHFPAWSCRLGWKMAPGSWILDPGPWIQEPDLGPRSWAPPGSAAWAAKCAFS